MPSAMAPVWYGQSPHASMNPMRPGPRFQHPSYPPPAQRRMSASHVHPHVPPPASYHRNPPPPRQRLYPVAAQGPARRPPQGHYPMMVHRGPPPPSHPHHPGLHNRQSPPTRFGPQAPMQPPTQMRVPQRTSYGEGPPATSLPPSMYPRTHFSVMNREVYSSNVPVVPPPAGPSPSPSVRDPSPTGHPPLKESLVHNVRQAFPPVPTEELSKQVDHEKTVSNDNSTASGMQDAASALISLKSIIEQAEAAREKRQDVSDDEESQEVKTFPSRLALPEDKEKLNSMHCFLRAELLELFLVEKSKPANVVSENKDDSSDDKAEESTKEAVPQPPPRIGLRCVHCAQARKIYGHECEAPMAVFYPKSIAELYRLVTSWQRVHLRKCRNLPNSVREKYTDLRQNDKTRGKTHYWVTSAKKLGLIDNPSRAGGIVFSP